MKNKVLSLILACMLFASFAFCANAAVGDSTVTVGTVTGKAGETVVVPITIDTWPTMDATDSTMDLGVNSMNFTVNFPKASLQVVTNGFTQGTAVNDSGKVNNWTIPLVTNANILLANNKGTFVPMWAQDGSGTDYYNGTPASGKDVLLTVSFKIKDGVEPGEYPITLTAFAAGKAVMDLNAATISTVDDSASYTTVAGKVVVEAEQAEEPVVPETSTVRTFPKLRWDEANKQLTTVGVITIGQDYDTIKYGINIEKDGVTNGVNYWANSAVKTTDEKEAYYAVRLDDIDDTKTDIKSTSAAKAILSNGAEGDAETKDSVIE